MTATTNNPLPHRRQFQLFGAKLIGEWRKVGAAAGLIPEPAAPTRTTSSWLCPSLCVWIADAPQTMQTAESFVTLSRNSHRSWGLDQRGLRRKGRIKPRHQNALAHRRLALDSPE